MVYQPVIPTSGLAGWNFLQATYDRQLDAFVNSAQVRNDKTYMLEQFSEPMSVEDFLNDRRLLQATLTAFDLGDEVWKRGFIDKVLTESSDPESTFLARLNNTQYTRLADALNVQNGTISLSEATREDIGTRFEAVSFKVQVGEIDNSMRLGLNYQSEIAETVTGSASNNTIMFRLLGSLPMRNVLETALNLPADVSQLDLEQQSVIFQDKIEEQFGIRDLSTLAEPENVERVIQRFQAIESLTSGPSATAPGSVALTLLRGIGSQSSANLFQSRFL